MVFNLLSILKLQNTCILLGINFLKLTNSRDDINLIHQLDPTSINKRNTRNKWTHLATDLFIPSLAKTHLVKDSNPGMCLGTDFGIRSVHFLMQ